MKTKKSRAGGAIKTKRSMIRGSNEDKEEVGVVAMEESERS